MRQASVNGCRRRGGRDLLMGLLVFWWLLWAGLWSPSALAQGVDEDDEEPAAQGGPAFAPGFAKRFGRGLLLERLRAGFPADQVSAAHELGRRRDEAAVPQLIERLEGDQGATSGPVSEAIVEALGQIGDRRAVPVLLGLLNARGPLQRAAVRSLGQIGDERALDPIATMLSRPSLTREAIAALLALGPRVLMRVVSLLRDPAAAGPACELLGRLGDRRATWPMVQALGSPRARVRRQCAAALGLLGDPRAQRALFGMLQDPDASVRRRALGALVSVADGSMGPALAPLVSDPDVGLEVIPALRGRTARAAVPALAQVATSEGPGQEAAVAALGRIGGSEAVSVLAELLRAPRSDLRFQAASALGRLDPAEGLAPLLRAARTGGPARIEGLRGLGDLYRQVEPMRLGRAVPDEVLGLARAALNDEDPEVAGAGAFLAGALGDEASLPALHSLLQARERRPELRALATSAVAWIGSSRSCEPLLEALADPTEGLRAAAAWALGELRCQQAGPSLTAVLERGPDGAAGNAAWAVGALGYHGAAPALLRRLDEGGPALRANAALALAALGEPRAGALIRRRFGREQSPRVRAALIDALGQLGDQASLALLDELRTSAGMIGAIAADGVAAIRRGERLTTPVGLSTFRTRLTDGQGNTLPDRWYTLALPDRRIVSGITDPSGEITLVGLPEGLCALGLGQSP